MNRGYLYLFLVLVSVVGGLLAPGWLQWLLVWIAIAAAYFSAGYFSGYGEMLLKSKKGRIPVYLKVLLLPVLVGATLYNMLARRLDNEQPMQKIRPGLWLGRKLTLAERNLLQENKITAVLDVTAEFDSPGSWFLPRDIEYFNIPIFDRMEPRKSQLLKAVQWVDKQRDAGREVLIHCALGQGRSVTMLMAYLLHLEPQKNITVLLNEIQAIRSTAAPNSRQLSLLQNAQESGLLTQQEKVFIVINPVAGTRPAEDDLALLEEIIGPFFDYTVFETQIDVSAEQLTRKAINSGATMVIAAGGDGTVMEVASVLAATDVKLGIIPRGTANALAVCLYGQAVRIEPVRSCCQHILSGTVKRIDVVKADERTMMLLAGIGMEAGMVERADRELKNRWGALAYLIGGWQQLESQDFFTATLTIDGKQHQFHTGSVTIANAAPNSSVFAQGGGQPSMDDGKLDATIIIDVEDKAEAIKVMGDLFLGVYASEADADRSKVKHLQGRVIELDAEPQQNVVIDGEMAGKTPVRFTVEPGALRVACEG